MAMFFTGMLFAYGIFASLAYMESEKELSKIKKAIKSKKNHPSSGLIQLNRKVG